MAYVMVVDDDNDFAQAVAAALCDAGHEVRIENSTEEAIAAMIQRRPDLAILDVMFPENPAAGFEAARAIASDHEKLKGMRILMLTAVNERFPLGFSPRDADDDWLPVTDFLEKPVALDALRARVEDLLAED